jgi:nitroimidazol reductase NimA-like FMN-containing flavoprotein (pyridoxamine 5'-phosphate oxidase superfamily)
LPDKFATEYESAVVFGVAAEVGDAERTNALLWLLKKYCPDYLDEGKQYMERLDKSTRVLKIEPHHITGKARR